MNTIENSDLPELFSNYLKSCAPQFREGLIKLREIILATAPGAEESFSYRIHCFKYVYMLVGIGANKTFCSFYTMSPGLIKQMKTELSGIKVSGATIHFKPGQQLPAELITKIIEARIKENEQLALSRLNALK